VLPLPRPPPRRGADVRLNQKRLPWPSPDATSSRPPISATRRALMASPRPAAAVAAGGAVSIWVKASNSSARRSAGMPMPVSVTVNAKRAARARLPFHRTASVTALRG
jgi:hypothetical protein